MIGSDSAGCAFAKNSRHDGASHRSEYGANETVPVFGRLALRETQAEG